ncbi:MAG: Eco57I restriction-modification methylase domain-containing protein, partial [Phocaeicola sp.]
MSENIKYRFIQNIGEYFPAGYFGDDFISKIQKCANLSADDMKELCKPYAQLHHHYNEYKNFIINQNPRRKDAVKRTHDFHTRLLDILGYDTQNAYAEPYVVNSQTEPIEMIPVRHILHRGSQVKMLIMEMQHLIPIAEEEPAGLFEQQYESESDSKTDVQRYKVEQWEFVFKLDRKQYKICPAVINKAVTQIFLMPKERRPHFILMLAGNYLFLFDEDKWARGSYLQFSLDELFTQTRIPAFRTYFALFHLLLRKLTLAADSEQLLMDTIIEESYKNAYEVTKDLKEGVILAVETLANEALYYMREVANQPFGKLNTETGAYDETDDSFENEVKDDCLTIVYRLLFIFYAESRSELEILPTNDEVYKRGYSLEALRDLEQVRLISDESRNGYFFDDSICYLFNLLSTGHKVNAEMGCDRSFRVRPIDSPLFDNNRLKQLKAVKIRNVKWQEIVKALSLSRKNNYCGRISYANLGVNQLGSVYESLLAFRGFYAEEDYIEVHKANTPSDGTFLVPYSRMASFELNEVLCDNETGEPKRLSRGTFVYRLNGRDRQKSASYYTPEVLTRSTVKYTIKAYIDEVASGKRKPQELLDLKILEPAMGAAAFQNEVINQLAEAYMTYVEKKPAPDKYRDELQKVKAYIATHNVYGVDLNPTAIELGKLSLWLNVIHKDMEPPFFANRLAVGNAVIGAWLKVYSKNEVVTPVVDTRRQAVVQWWTKAPHKVKFYQNRVNRSVNEVYHFLLPDKNMLAVLGIKEQKKERPIEAKVMQDKLKKWTELIGEAEFKQLQRISAKIDLLLRECLETHLSIENLTDNKRNIWGVSGEMNLNLELYAEKERIFDTRYRHDNAYYKLKMVMDYWCALWFWEYQDANSLPTRTEYWEEIEKLLNISDTQLDKNTQRALAKNVVEEPTLNFGTERMTESEAQIVLKSKEVILHRVQAQQTLFAEEEPFRFKIVNRLAQRYHFFHPMLEFIEVFWLRGGFDIICGNPPWLKLQFDDKAIFSERYPEVAIRKLSAPDARAIKSDIMADLNMRYIYESEQVETECSATFMNAYANYPLLIGQQTNLYKCVLTNS